VKYKYYNREKAREYAEKWGYKRNPQYYNFDNIGGDCTSFVSQCLYAGSNVMNYKKDIGWYYNSINDRAAAWSGVEFLYKFLINNKGVGPQGNETNINKIEIGDSAQLSFDGNKFAHTLIIVNIKKNKSLDNIYVASHTLDTYNKKISEYNFKKIRFIHIEKIGIN